jgi:uncharacterized protein YjbI with pentapeptide repeats
MANQEHLKILKQGVEVWNKWREEHPDIQPDLNGAILTKANLILANFSEAHLSKANLIGATLGEAILQGAHLDGANLSRAILSGADLSKAHLHYARLEDAQLNDTILCDVDLSSADLTNANLKYARFSGANLSGAKLNFVNLRGANLSGVNLSHANLHRANLIEADLRDVNLIRADLSGAYLSRADLTRADLTNANLGDANLGDTNLSGADLSGAILVRAFLERANLTNCRIYGISAWDVKLNEAIQLDLVITPPEQPQITVDDLEVAQFIFLLLKYEKLRNVLNSVMERGVLLLGRFNDGGLDLLQAIAVKLREVPYLPIIFDFDRPHSRNLTETVMTLVGLSKFVIVDLSGPSVANELRATIPHFKIPFIPIIEESRKKEVYFMFSDFSEEDWVLPLVTFTDRENLMELLPTMVIEPAERKCEERQIRLKQIFNR